MNGNQHSTEGRLLEFMLYYKSMFMTMQVINTRRCLVSEIKPLMLAREG